MMGRSGYAGDSEEGVGDNLFDQIVTEIILKGFLGLNSIQADQHNKDNKK